MRFLKTMRRGMTLIEIIVSIAIIVFLVAVYVMVANPAAQLATSRNSERTLELQAVMNAIRQNIADQSNEQFSCAAGPVPTTTTNMASASGSYNIAPCLVPTYGLFTLPVDPSASSAHWTSISDYDTGYAIMMNASGSITLSAPNAELQQTVSITR